MLAAAFLLLLAAQRYDLVFRGGRVLDPRNGIDGILDVAGERREATRKLECELTLRAGKAVWDLNGIRAAARPVKADEK